MGGWQGYPVGRPSSSSGCCSLESRHWTLDEGAPNKEPFNCGPFTGLCACGRLLDSIIGQPPPPLPPSFLTSLSCDKRSQSTEETGRKCANGTRRWASNHCVFTPALHLDLVISNTLNTKKTMQPMTVGQKQA